MVKDRFIEWSKICKKIIVWDYHVYFDNYFIYMPSIRAYKTNIDFYKKYGAKYIYNEGALYGDSSGFHALKVYLLSTLLWNCGQDENKLIEDFINNYYKVGAVFIRKYLLLLENNFKRLEKLYDKSGKKGYHTAFNTSWQPDVLYEKHYSLKFLNKCKKILLKAVKAAESVSDSDEKNKISVRIKKELLSVEYLLIENYSEYDSQNEYRLKIENFKRMCGDCGIIRFNHGSETGKHNVDNKTFEWICRWPAVNE